MMRFRLDLGIVAVMVCVCDVACDVIDGVGEEFVVLGAFARAQVALSSKFQCTDPIGVPYR